MGQFGPLLCNVQAPHNTDDIELLLPVECITAAIKADNSILRDDSKLMGSIVKKIL